MRIRCFAGGVSYLIEAPDGSRVERLSHLLGSTGESLADRLLVPGVAGEVAIPAEPPAVLALLAGEGAFGLRLLFEADTLADLSRIGPGTSAELRDGTV